MSACVFCDIVAGESPATVVREWNDALAIVPLNPVVSGHLLVLPKRHVQTFFSDPDTSATTMRRAAEMLHGVERHHEPRDHNVITSAGRAATQTVDHLHVHIVPREHGDGLRLPWSPNECGRCAVLAERLEQRRVMAREVLESEGLGHVAALIPIEEVQAWVRGPMSADLLGDLIRSLEAVTVARHVAASECEQCGDTADVVPRTLATGEQADGAWLCRDRAACEGRAG